MEDGDSAEVGLVGSEGKSGLDLADLGDPVEVVTAREPGGQPAGYKPRLASSPIATPTP